MKELVIKHPIILLHFNHHSQPRDGEDQHVQGGGHLRQYSIEASQLLQLKPLNSEWRMDGGGRLLIA